jgi:hypothetical protein
VLAFGAAALAGIESFTLILFANGKLFECRWDGRDSEDAPFISGVILSLLNPLHLPFWMGWTAVLRRKGLLNDTRKEYNIYVLAIGMGRASLFSFMA